MQRVEEFWRPGRTVPVADILGSLRRGAGDPTMVLASRDLWWAVSTPLGPAVSWWQVQAHGPSDDEVRLLAVGPGAAWFAGRLSGMLGGADDVSGFRAQHDQVAAALRHRRHRDWRVPRTELVLGALVPSILEQKVTGKQAFAGYRHLVLRHGTPVDLPSDLVAAAGPQAGRVARLVAPPSARQWRRIPSWEWLQAGVEPPQSRTIMRVCEVADSLERTADLAHDEAHRRLRSVPGIGVWTAAKVAQTAWGDADAPTFADYHIAKQVGHAVLGRDIDDDGLAQVLEPYRGHRFRAERLLLASGFLRPRHGPRMALPAHLPNRAVR